MSEKLENIDIYNLSLHEYADVNDGIFRGTIIRVPGGWLYSWDMPGYGTATTTFVPFDNEFMKRVRLNE